MHNVRMEDGRLVVDPEGPLALPADLSRELLQAIFDIDEPDDLGHVDDIHRRISDADKDRFEQACRTFGEPFESLWSLAATTWASVGGVNGKWDLSGMQICFRESIQSWLVQDVVLTTDGIWFIYAREDGAIWTQAEFEARYAQSLAEHLASYIEYRKQICDRLIKTMYEGLVEVEVQLELEDGRLLIEKRRGPAAVPVKEWRFRPGEKFIATTES